MFNFITCDDDAEISKNVIKIIDNIMMKNKLEYKTFHFEDYNKEFLKIMNSGKTNKIYILDIHTPHSSGIDIARKIRETDTSSVLIFLTNHYELGQILLDENLMFLSFISKLNNYEEKLEKAIKRALKVCGHNKSIQFTSNGRYYSIPLDEILYITYDSIERKSIIVTKSDDYPVAKTLKELSVMLDVRFEKTHRACLTNIEHVRVIDTRNQTVKFDNGKEIKMVSKNYNKLSNIK